jgi:hypothetical protein
MDEGMDRVAADPFTLARAPIRPRPYAARRVRTATFSPTSSDLRSRREERGEERHSGRIGEHPSAMAAVS